MSNRRAKNLKSRRRNAVWVNSIKLDGDELIEELVGRIRGYDRGDGGSHFWQEDGEPWEISGLEVVEQILDRIPFVLSVRESSGMMLNVKFDVDRFLRFAEGSGFRSMDYGEDPEDVLDDLEGDPIGWLKSAKREYGIRVDPYKFAYEVERDDEDYMSEPKTARSRRAKPRRSLLSVHLKKQIEEFVDSGEKTMRTNFNGQFKDASFSVRKTPNGSLVLKASWHGKSDFGASYKDGVQEYKLRAGYSDRSLDNVAARAVNFVLETKNRWYHINEIYNRVERELDSDEKVEFEDFVASKGIQVLYAEMTSDEAIEVGHLLDKFQRGELR